jgi:hypothetical protein
LRHYAAIRVCIALFIEQAFPHDTLFEFIHLSLSAHFTRENSMFGINRYLGLAHSAVKTGVVALALVISVQSVSASDYCRMRYGPSPTTIVRGVNGTPCGINCTASRNARWAKIRRCEAMRAHN